MLGEDVNDDVDLANRLRHLVPAEVRRVLDILTAHGRPITRSLLLATELITAAQLDQTHASGLLNTDWGLLRPRHEVSAVDDMPVDRHGELLRQLADGFARVAVDDGPDSAMATLEAHRHYSGLGDLRSARRFARFGVQLLLAMGRRAS